MADLSTSNCDHDYLVVDVGGASVALGMRFVQEIVRAVAVTPIPAAPKWVSGAINVRGRAMAVVDLRVRLMDREPIVRASDNMVLVEDDGIEFALLVDAALDVTTLEHDFASDRNSWRDSDVVPVHGPNQENDLDNQVRVRNSVVGISSKTLGHISLMLLDLDAIIEDCEEHLQLASGKLATG